MPRFPAYTALPPVFFLSPGKVAPARFGSISLSQLAAQLSRGPAEFMLWKHSSGPRGNSSERPRVCMELLFSVSALSLTALSKSSEFFQSQFLIRPDCLSLGLFTSGQRGRVALWARMCFDGDGFWVLFP